MQTRSKHAIDMLSAYFICFLFFNLSNLHSDNLIPKDTQRIIWPDTRVVIYVVKYTAVAEYRVTNDIIVHTHKKLHTSTAIYAHFHHVVPTIFAHTCEPNIKLYNKIWTSIGHQPHTHTLSTFFYLKQRMQSKYKSM